MSIKTAYLFNFVNPAGTRRSFVVPVFMKDGAYYMQDGVGKIERFIRWNMPPNLEGLPGRTLSISSLNVGVRNDVGDPPLYGFEFPDGVLYFGRKDGMKEMFRQNLSCLRPHPFVFSEVCEFLGLEDETKKALEECRDVLAESNPEIAARWFDEQWSWTKRQMRKLAGRAT